MKGSYPLQEVVVGGRGDHEGVEEGEGGEGGQILLGGEWSPTLSVIR